MDLDQVTAVRKQHHKVIPHQFFMPEMYCQPTLGRTAPVLPAPYRRLAPKINGPSSTNTNNTNNGGGAGNEVAGSSRALSSATASTVWDIEQGKHSIGNDIPPPSLSTISLSASSNTGNSVHQISSNPNKLKPKSTTAAASSRQSLGAKGMYAYDDASDEEDIQEHEQTLQEEVITGSGFDPDEMNIESHQQPNIISPHSNPLVNNEVLYMCV